MPYVMKEKQIPQVPLDKLPLEQQGIQHRGRKALERIQNPNERSEDLQDGKPGAYKEHGMTEYDMRVQAALDNVAAKGRRRSHGDLLLGRRELQPQTPIDLGGIKEKVKTGARIVGYSAVAGAMGASLASAFSGGEPTDTELLDKGWTQPQVEAKNRAVEDLGEPASTTIEIPADMMTGAEAANIAAAGAELPADAVVPAGGGLPLDPNQQS